VAVIDTTTASLTHSNPTRALRDKETRKRNKYEERVRLSGSFAHLVCSIYGTLAPEADRILTITTEKIRADRQVKRDTVCMQRISLQFSIVKAVSHCLRSRSRINYDPSARPMF
jgi:hypothetical protein